MSRVQQFRATVEENPGLNLEDYLTIMGATEPGKRNSLRTQIRRTLVVGGSNRDLVETGKVKSARRPNGISKTDAWAIGVERVESTFPVVVETSGAKALREMAQQFSENISDETQKALNNIAQITKSGVSENKFNKVVPNIETVVRQELVATLEARHYQEVAAERQAHIETLQENQKALYALLNRLTGGENEVQPSFPDQTTSNATRQ